MSHSHRFKIGDVVQYVGVGRPMTVTAINWLYGRTRLGWEVIYKVSPGALGADEWVAEDYIEIMPPTSKKFNVMVEAVDAAEAKAKVQTGNFQMEEVK